MTRPLISCLGMLVLVTSSVFGNVESGISFSDRDQIPPQPAGTLRIFIGELLGGVGTSFLYLYEGEAIQVRYDPRQSHDEPYEVRYIPIEEIENEVERFGRRWYFLSYDAVHVKDIPIQGDRALEDFIFFNFMRAREVLGEWTPIVQVNPIDVMGLDGDLYGVEEMPEDTRSKTIFGAWLVASMTAVALSSMAAPAIGFFSFVHFLNWIRVPQSLNDVALGYFAGQLSLFAGLGAMRFLAWTQEKKMALVFGRGGLLGKTSRSTFVYSSVLHGGAALYMGCAVVLRSLGLPLP